MKIYSTFLIFLGTSCVVFATPPSPESSPFSRSATSVSPLATPSPALLSPNHSPSVDPNTIPSGTTDEGPNASGTLPSAADEGPNAGGAPSGAADEEALPSSIPGPSGATDPNALIPPAEATPTPVNPQFAEAQRKENAAKELIRYKAVRVEAEKDPAVRSMYNRAEKTSTEEDYRAAMREYYRRLFKKVELLDPSLTKKARGMQEAYQRRLAQTQIEPTIPLHPPPTPVPLSP